MELRFLPIFAFLSLALVVSHATLPSEVYWQSVLPDTPMPKAIRDLLWPDLTAEKSASVVIGKGGVHVVAGKGKPGGTSVDVGKGGVHVNTGKPGGSGTAVNVGKGGVTVNTGKGKPHGTSVNVGRKGGVGVHTGKPGGGSGTHVNVGKGGVTVNTGHKGKPVYVGVHPGASPFLYKYAASEDQLRDDPNVALFFMEKDLNAGTKMNLRFTKTTSGATFLPRQVADTIPFSSKALPQILRQFSVEPQSEEAELMKNTLEDCEMPAMEGEDKLCATSLESMVDFSTSKLGKHVVAMSTEVDKENTKRQQYTISPGVEKLSDDKSVVCHSENYPYAVFYCHATQTTRAYAVPLVGADGTKAKAVAVCHTDTAKWNPKHLAFQVLKVKPGTVPVCHFLPEDHVVWVGK
ncbi:PREDICTED: BURP domain protein RD22 [Nelumbo nucifera]|uniref:BURP domain protein RD22 n=1 Tax=Nelumbo nucifera TaxID=4432 RepID=A0A1U7ZMI5_NELNU|nr:PREDICTED: BURP domain protein RD22 [Nelumbo nucifera]